MIKKFFTLITILLFAKWLSQSQNDIVAKPSAPSKPNKNNVVKNQHTYYQLIEKTKAVKGHFVTSNQPDAFNNHFRMICSMDNGTKLLAGTTCFCSGKMLVN